MRRHWQYLKYVLRHKWFVFLAGLKLGVPILTLIVHDWDKFLPDEWFPYARTFYKPNGEKQYLESPEFAQAWMKHQHRNKHHWQYWLIAGATPLPATNLIVWDRGETQMVLERNSGSATWLTLHDMPHVELTARPMPEVDWREMLADWKGAGRALGKPDTRAWYLANRDKMILHSETRKWIEAMLLISGHDIQAVEAAK